MSPSFGAVDSEPGQGAERAVAGLLGEIGQTPGDGKRAVALGGGHGLSRCLQALSHVVDHVTAVITTADDGGSSGRLRRTLGIVPPGDLRMALAAMSPRSELVRLIQYRFGSGDVEGHSLGNLLIVALTDLHGGDVVAALDQLAGMLGACGRALPCTPEPVQLHARLTDREVSGQVTVARSRRVQEVWLEPADPPATPDAVEAVANADVVVLGPGSLFTSVIPNLLVPDLLEAVAAASCPVVYVANLREQSGETEGLDLTDHLDALFQHGPGLKLAAIVAHDGPPDPAPGRPLHGHPEVLSGYAREVLLADVVHPHGGHDPAKLAGALSRVLRTARPGRVS